MRQGTALTRKSFFVWAVLDTSVDIGHWERGLYAESLAVLRKAFIIRPSDGSAIPSMGTRAGAEASRTMC
jgi:hypothetical protein